MNFHHFVRSATHFVSWEPEFTSNLSSGIQTISSRGTTSHKDIKTRKKDKDVAVPPPTPFDWQAISADCRAATPQQLSISHEGENKEEEGKKKNCRLTL